jgi:hypothetical protein
MNTDPDYKNLVNLLAVLSDATNRQAVLQQEIDAEYLELVDPRKQEYAANQQAISEAEAAIETIAQRHPEWFAKVKTLKTPYGSVKSTSSPKLQVPSEDASIRLILAAGRKDEFIRESLTLDKESLEKLKDHELAEFGITRVKNDSLTIKPATIDLGKAVQAAEEASQQAA